MSQSGSHKGRRTNTKLVAQPCRRTASGGNEFRALTLARKKGKQTSEGRASCRLTGNRAAQAHLRLAHHGGAVCVPQPRMRPLAGLRQRRAVDIHGAGSLFGRPQRILALRGVRGAGKAPASAAVQRSAGHLACASAALYSLPVWAVSSPVVCNAASWHADSAAWAAPLLLPLH